MNYILILKSGQTGTFLIKLKLNIKFKQFEFFLGWTNCSKNMIIGQRASRMNVIRVEEGFLL